VVGVGDTVAVKVTDWPDVDGLADGESVVVVRIWLTVCVTLFEVLPASFVSPEYTAVMV
jgi:protein involved in polysaccharide export with SLBB domain